MKFLLMAASVRHDSCNKKLINLVAKILTKQNIEIKLLDFADFVMPLYDGNVEEKSGVPTLAKEFIALLKDHNGLIIASPEYNYTTPGTLKNLIDWVSRERPMPWVNYPIMLCSASPALVGGNRGLLNTTTALQCACNARVFPPMFSLSNAYDAFAEDDSLKDKNLEQDITKNITGFTKFVNRL